MKQLLFFALVIGLSVIIAGCTDILPARNATATFQPTPTPVVPRYIPGDIVVKGRGSGTGEVVLSYNPTPDSYQTRSIVYNEYGSVFFYEGGEKTIKRIDLETYYPITRSHVDYPYKLPDLQKEYSPEYGTGRILTKENEPHEGIIILGYDYPRDVYTFAYALYQGGAWIYDINQTYEGARTDVERRY